MGFRDGLDLSWALVLAAGDGTRLRSLTTTADGLVIPKQFCTFGGPRSLLGSTLERAQGLVPPERIAAVVAEKHRRWWSTDLQALPPWNVVVQPENRGTAVGILLPMLHLAAQDPEAVVLVLPSDHHVEDDAALQPALRQALRVARRDEGVVALVGIVPDEADPDYGWIVPGERTGDGTRGVESFVEKPDRAAASRLMAQGALWSSFMMAGSVGSFLALFGRAVPELMSCLRGRESELARGPAAAAVLESLYRELPVQDFSTEVLQPGRDMLRVITAPPCGWSDLGTPARIARWANRRGMTVAVRHAPPSAGIAAS